ncbi:MAG: lysophospholipid acyltransferase family protein [Planctomycetota bacterium]
MSAAAVAQRGGEPFNKGDSSADGPQPTMRWHYALGRRLLLGYFRGLHGVVYMGSERIPRHGPVLVVANHQSYYDPPLIGSGIGCRPLDFLARAGLFRVPLFGRFIRAFNAFPIKEDTGDRAAIEAVVRRLQAGGTVLVFPEGRRTRDGHLMPLKRGVALVLRRAKVPVVPVAIDGVFDVWPRHRALPTPFAGPMGVHYGEPIEPGDQPRDADALLAMLHDRLEAQKLEIRLELLKRSEGTFPRPLPPVSPPTLD